MTRLKDKIAIITGGGSGIGRGIAVALAREGAIPVVCGRRRAKLDETLELVRLAGGSGLAVQADVSQEQDVERIIKTVLETLGRIDILINNAAIYNSLPLHEENTANWDQTMATNLRAPFMMARAVLPHMRRQRSGHIINISSESGLEYYPEDASYGVSKHALNALGEYIQRENQDLYIRVNTICPGMVVTEMTENEPGLDHTKCLYPEDIAELAVWLLTRRQNIKIGTPILIQTMLNPWE